MPIEAALLGTLVTSDKAVKVLMHSIENDVIVYRPTDYRLNPIHPSTPRLDKERGKYLDSREEFNSEQWRK